MNKIKDIASKIKHCSIKDHQAIELFSLLKKQQKHYSKFEFLGNGGFAFCIQAFNSNTNKSVALKIVECEKDRENGRELVQQEYKLLKNLAACKYIVQIQESFFQQKNLILVMMKNMKNRKKSDLFSLGIVLLELDNLLTFEFSDMIDKSECHKGKVFASFNISRNTDIYKIAQTFLNPEIFNRKSAMFFLDQLFHKDKAYQNIELTSIIVENQLHLKSQQIRQIQKSISIQKNNQYENVIYQSQKQQEQVNNILQEFQKIQQKPFSEIELQNILKNLFNIGNFEKKFEIIDYGAVGLILGAFNKYQNRACVLKVQKVISKAAIAKEVGIIRSCQMPLVVKFYGYFYLSVNQKEDYVVYELERCQCNLKQYLSEQFVKGVFSDELKERIAHQMLDSVNYLHYLDIIHRDIKLKNFLVQEVYGQPVVKLINSSIPIITLYNIYSKNWENSLIPPSPEGIILPDLSKILDIKITSIGIRLIGYYASQGSVIDVSFAVDGIPISPYCKNYAPSIYYWGGYATRVGSMTPIQLSQKPPFETHDVKTTYRKIKSNTYSFPDHAPIPDSAKALIQLILQQDPGKRPILDEILAHPFINNGGTIPRLLPVSTLTTAPNASYIKQYAPSATNIKANQQPFPTRTEVFGSSRKEMIKSQTTTNMNKGLNNFANENNNKIFDAQKNVATNNPSNQFMSTANLQQNSKNLNSNFNQNDFNQPTTSTGQTGTQQGLYNKQQTGNQDPNNKQGNKYQSVQNLISINKTDGFQNPQNQQKANDEENNQIDGSKNNLWVVQYVDQSSKYGLGYLLCNKSAGVVFNDTTKIILDPKTEYFEYIYKKEQDEITEKHPLAEYPQELQNKVTLLQHFCHYLMTEVNKRVCAENGSTQAALYNNSKFQMQPNQPLPYLKKWMKARHAIMFRLSNKIVQVQFSDKTEILLNSTDKIVSFMNKKGERFHYPLADAMNSTNQDMTKRLRYTKEILTHLLKNNQRQNTNDDQGNNPANNIAPPDDMPQNEPNYNKYGMTATMENEQFPKLNEQKLKAMTSQKGLTEKDQLMYNVGIFNNGGKTSSQQKNPSVAGYPSAQQQPAQPVDKNQKK
ncbi:hypothetical protein ABPG72_011118 [Tetrahymena utriculariae]